jgi:hypothetical protein
LRAEGDCLQPGPNKAHNQTSRTDIRTPEEPYVIHVPPSVLPLSRVRLCPFVLYCLPLAITLCPALKAQSGSSFLIATAGVAIASAGNLYVADTGKNASAKARTGSFATAAGNGTQGFGGDSGPATSAQLSQPYGTAVDSAGNLYIADFGNNRIRKVSNGIITTMAGGGMSGLGDNGPAKRPLGHRRGLLWQPLHRRI